MEQKVFEDFHEHAAECSVYFFLGIFILQKTFRCQAKFLTCEISVFTPCTHAQSNILHTKHVDKTDC